ncbi:MAG: 50S ribosomal protein L7Ae-like protein [Firmicutes bacterium]|nr:50S ribosomal protein L7Ae-like protein [Bacillota bacterium]
MTADLTSAKKLVGAKQTLKALQTGQARAVYVAKDADTHVTQPIVQLCSQTGVKVIEVASMAELGKACSIDVGAAVAAIIE